MECLKNGEFVINGTVLCETEQYIGENDSTFEEDGKLIAAQSGFLKINDMERTITIQNKNSTVSIKKGDHVICEAQFLRKFSLGCRLHKVGDQLIHNKIYGNIHVSQISNSYVEGVDELFSKTDILRAFVTGIENGEFALTTKSAPNLGVIYAQCSICGTKMNRQSNDMVVCPFCGNTSRKKLANDYDDFDEVVKPENIMY